MEWTAQTIKELRQRAGWSIAEFSRRLSVKSDTVRCWEDGVKEPDDHAVMELEKIVLQLDKYNFETISTPASEVLMSEEDIDQVLRHESIEKVKEDLN